MLDKATVTRAPDPATLASDLRVAIGQLVRRLRAEHAFPLSHGTVLGHLDREGAQSISDLAAFARVRPQSMAQTVKDLEEAGYVARSDDPDDRRRALVEMTPAGRIALDADRRHRDGWLATGIADELTREDQVVLARAVVLLRRLTER